MKGSSCLASFLCLFMYLMNALALKCPDTPIIKDFDLKQYSGTW